MVERKPSEHMNREQSTDGLPLFGRLWNQNTGNLKPGAIRPGLVWGGALVLALLASDAAAYLFLGGSLREASVHSAVLNVMVWTAFLAVATWNHPPRLRVPLLILITTTAVSSVVFLPIALNILPRGEMGAVVGTVFLVNVVNAALLATGLQIDRLREGRATDLQR